MKLNDIERKITDAQNSLAELKACTSLDDIDQRAQKISTLQTKLSLLQDAAAAERERLQAEDAAAKRTARKTLLEGVAANAERLAATHATLTADALELIEQLAGVLAKREQLFTMESVGLDNARELLPASELNELLHNLSYAATAISNDDFGTAWQAAVFTATGNNKQLYDRLARLVVAPRYVEGAQAKGLTAATPSLIAATSEMAAHDPATPAPEQPAQQRPVPQQTVNLRTVN